ncbi:pyridoxamine 5'-phosphate oxidase [Dietzia psychralcaliphila]|uniref:Pyridoxine/pyridoxamine 5'-phosphate oxidase n=1 Tax=Dietzia psychralcaliphila TaxID=139021 RepID=A0AAD0JQ86_9ACTN|nr:pyridoxamine 5'-phosphate oxidase [Dietzia psychralcaliphila]AWH94804.1 pyridoxamine 5'-phosphate oxidase [Dietzia psychralcaliphila]PTM86911.1 pyridoxamine 5'-phosphate oxidase [Dietzia psychralcaliphila]
MEDPVLEPADFDTMRVGYGLHTSLDVTDLHEDWLPLFASWLDEAGRRGVREPNAMVLGTVGADRRPSTRTVLCKGADERGLTFFTTTSSRKGAQLAESGYASATFPWLVVERQIHVEGECRPLDRADSLAYWRTRPRGSQVAAWASEQSQPVETVEELSALYAIAEERLSDVEEIPMPDRWGGYRLRPDRVEFWQGGRDRFHDRVECLRGEEGWTVRRLQP